VQWCQEPIQFESGFCKNACESLIKIAISLKVTISPDSGSVGTMGKIVANITFFSSVARMLLARLPINLFITLITAQQVIKGGFSFFSMSTLS